MQIWSSTGDRFIRLHRTEYLSVLMQSGKEEEQKQPMAKNGGQGAVLPSRQPPKGIPDLQEGPARQPPPRYDRSPRATQELACPQYHTTEQLQA